MQSIRTKLSSLKIKIREQTLAEAEDFLLQQVRTPESLKHSNCACGTYVYRFGLGLGLGSAALNLFSFSNTADFRGGGRVPSCSHRADYIAFKTFVNQRLATLYFGNWVLSSFGQKYETPTQISV